MKKVRIITDSASDLHNNIPENVTVLPLTVCFGDTEYLDGVTITHHEFYERLIECDILPSTSLISPGRFEEAYQKAIAAGETVIVITVSSKLSGTYQSAMLASLDHPDDVLVVDSLNAAIGEQLLVKYASELAKAGMDATEIVDELNAVKHKIHLLAVLDTLEYLKKGGRISSTTALVGGMLSIKPVLTIKNGSIEMLGKARGSKNGNNFLIKEIAQTNGIDFCKPLCLGYTGLSDHFLQKYIKDSSSLYEGHEDCLTICSIGAAIGTHVGPNAIAVAFFEK